ncbi:MAG: bifunctional phosphoribosyl-AMP cyclohydrolase/phosphoribosyl-ATP diphosphatase HisIE [Bacteroidales bacterium]|nr:bifunctional phosphoribosyl-AMP cyclohydrolase/phosphoribosyl-ATP diphosphatase HisIE [Bacteroidales bacterium]
MLVFNDFDLSRNADSLLPVIVQDSRTLKVLMLGYMNEEAFRKTCSEGKVTFFSRSRQKLWTKGETSGNWLYVKEMYKDCDCDTLLVMAEPAGPVCHRGTTSCFDTPEEEGFIRYLQSLIQQRHQLMPEGSYTSRLFSAGVKKSAQKVGEEAVETVIEAVDGNPDRYIYEVSDLIYHLLVLNEAMGVSIADLEKELRSRNH